MHNVITFYLIRHGESFGNIQSHLIGQDPNCYLTKNGENQAKTLGRFINLNYPEFTHIYCSPYQRAVDTCKIACNQFTNLSPVFVDALREYSAGDMIGKLRSEVMSQYEKEMHSLGMHFKFPNGESLYEVERRVVNWLSYCFLSPPIDKNLNIALFTHGMVIKSLLHYIMNFDHRITWRISIDNASVTKVSLIDNLWFVKSINDTKHLVV